MASRCEDLRQGGCDRGDRGLRARPDLRGCRRVPLHRPPQKAAAEESDDRSVRVVEFPREALNTDIAAYVRENAHTVPKKRFGKNAWSLETSAVDDLMEKIRTTASHSPSSPGSSHSRHKDRPERSVPDRHPHQRAARPRDPRSAEIIKPYLRGQDIKRWSPEWKRTVDHRRSSIAATTPGPGLTPTMPKNRPQNAIAPCPMKPWREAGRAGRTRTVIGGSFVHAPITTLSRNRRSCTSEIQFTLAVRLESAGVLQQHSRTSCLHRTRGSLPCPNSPLMWWHSWRH